jgi:phosphorylase kinase alpha/beta subunit
MTDYELNFSIKVEEMLSRINEPVLRQIVVEMFVIIHTILCRNPELKFTKAIEVEKMVEQAIHLYASDKNLSESAHMAFYNEKQSINSGTTAYLSRVCIEYLLKSSSIYSASIDTSNQTSHSSAVTSSPTTNDALLSRTVSSSASYATDTSCSVS